MADRGRVRGGERGTVGCPRAVPAGPGLAGPVPAGGGQPGSAAVHRYLGRAAGHPGQGQLTVNRFGALRDRQFRRLFAGQALSSFGDSALYLTLGIWAKTLTGSNAAAGGVFLALGIPALFAPAAGHLADRVRRRPLLICANALTAALVLSLLAVHSRSQLWIIYLVAFGYGVAF